MEKVNLIDVTPENVMQETLFCVKNTADPGFKKKQEWYAQRFQVGSFSLLRDGILLEDHYLSETRFRNILNKELKKL